MAVFEKAHMKKNRVRVIEDKVNLIPTTPTDRSYLQQLFALCTEKKAKKVVSFALNDEMIILHD